MNRTPSPNGGDGVRIILDNKTLLSYGVLTLALPMLSIIATLFKQGSTMAVNSKKKLATVNDVAKLAEVSPVTASRVFNPKWDGKIKEVTREKVMQAARLANYTPNAIARSLFTNRTNIVAVVVGIQVGYFYSEIFFKLLERLQDAGKKILVFSVDPAKSIENIVSQVHQYRVDAILVMANATSTYIENYFVEYGTPVILFDRLSHSDDIYYVCSDNLLGARMAADFLIENKHRSIAYISGDNNRSQALGRSENFTKRVKEQGGKIVVQLDGDFTYNCGYESMLQLLKYNNLDAVFCSDDTMAMGAIDAARAHGYSIPADISIMGFDNHSVSGLPGYNITTISHQQDFLLDALIELLESVLTNSVTKRHLLFPMKLLVRGSVKMR
jgi:DNA-binding LacI/PurR family transcriptional regulator